MSGKRLVVLCLVIAASVTFGFVAPLSAHTEVWEQSPRSGIAYGGTIDQIQISFVASVATSEISLVGPDDEPVEISEARLESSDRIAIAEFDELSEPGRYLVTHSELAADGDIQTARFQFFFDPTSENRVTPLLGQDGPNWVTLSIIAGVVLVLAGLFWPGRSKA